MSIPIPQPTFPRFRLGHSDPLRPGRPGSLSTDRSPCPVKPLGVLARCRPQSASAMAAGWGFLPILLTFVAFACATQPAFSQSSQFYLDSAAIETGNGSLETPWKSFAAVPWTQIETLAASGTSVQLRIKRGSQFFERVVIGGSGTKERPIFITAYGEGPKPEIHAGLPLERWIRVETAPGRVWRLNAPSPDSVSGLVSANDFLTKGTSLTGLKDNQWWMDADQLYLRMDSEFDHPEGPHVYALTRDRAIDCRGRHDLVFDDLRISGGSSAAVYVANGSQLRFQRCSIDRTARALDLVASKDVVVSGSQFGFTTGNAIVLKGPDSSARFFFSVMAPGPFGASSVRIEEKGSDFDFVNCTFVGSRSRHIHNVGANTIRAANCIFSVPAASDQTQAGAEITSTAGTVTVTDSLVQPNGQIPAQIVEGALLGPGCIHTSPGFVRNASKGFLCLGMDDSGSFSAFTNLLRMANQRNLKTYLALDGVEDWNPMTPHLQQAIHEGHDLLCHTSTHSLLAETNAIIVEYRGSGTAPTLEIRNGSLFCAIDGVPAGEVSLSTSLAKIATAIGRIPGFTARIWSGLEAGVPGGYLREFPATPITGPTTLTWDMPFKWRQELQGWQIRIASRFQGQDGSSYQQPLVAYPSGSHSSEVENALSQYGFIGGRTTFYPGRKLRNLNLYTLNAAPIFMGRGAQIQFERDLDDQGGTYSFQGTNLTFSTSAFEGSFSGVFNGTNAFAFAPTDPIWDMSLGDWHIALAVRTDSLSAEQAIFHRSNDNENGITAWMDTDGRVSLRVRQEGSEALRLATAPGTLSPSFGWKKLKFQQTGDDWQIRVDGKIEARATSKVRAQNYSGAFLLGCEQDWQNNQMTHHFSGQLDHFSHSKHTYYNTQALMDTAAQAGFVFMPYTHGYFNSPEMLEIVLDAASEYPGGSAVCTSPSAAFKDVFASAVVVSNKWVTLTNLPPPDYRLTQRSPAVGAADSKAFKGVPHLTDPDGRPVTDETGLDVLGLPKPHMGAYQNVPVQLPDRTPPRLTIRRLNQNLELFWPVSGSVWTPLRSVGLSPTTRWEPIDVQPLQGEKEWVAPFRPTNNLPTFFKLSQP